MPLYHDCDSDELRSYCRSAIESLEMWTRRLIDDLLREKYGPHYLEAKEGNTPIIKSAVKERAQKILSTKQSSSLREVDGLFLEDILYILTKDDLYYPLFKPVLDYVYPNNKQAIRMFLERIIPIRNDLSHANPISVRQAEQVICYSHDFVEGIKEYYKMKGKEKMWNVPTIIKITDSLGNEHDKRHNKVDHIFYVGDSYTLTAEIDNSFSPDEYTIRWLNMLGQEYSGTTNLHQISLTFTNRHVGEHLSIRCLVSSKKDWHRHNFCDDEKSVNMTVLPAESK